MKKLASILILPTLAVVGGLASCSKLTRGFDQNPNTATDAPATLQLTAAELSEGFIMSGEMARIANIWAGVFHGAGNQYLALQSYITTATDYDNAWTSIYQTTLAQLRIVESKSAANKQLLGIAQVTEAQMIGTTTALWGDVPYSTAFVADTDPTYDAQKDVYASTQTLLSTAITNLSANAGAGATINADVFFAGSQLKWVAAAHSLKARYYLHVKNYAQAAAEAKQGISSTSGDMLMPYAGVISTSANPYWDFNVNSRPTYMDAVNSYAPELLLARVNSATNDTARFNYYYTKAHAVAIDLNTDDGAFQATSSFPLISYVETQAILAESLQRTGDATGALIALNNIRAADATAYKAAGGVYNAYTTSDFVAGGVANPSGSGLSQSDALLKEILTEKYLSLIGQMEEFNDVRRTNNLIGVPKNVSTATSLPQRLLYPQVEINTNSNVPSPPPSLFTKTSVNQ